jgi:hypothetical protein
MNSIFTELRDEIINGRCILFLGSGSTAACESPSGGGLTGEGLAQAIIRSIGEDPSNFTATLMEAGEYVEAHSPQHRTTLDNLIYSRLHDLRPTLGHLLLTKFPWKAIVTTNYNRVVETGFEVAKMKGVTQYSCVPFRTDEELKVNSIGQNQIPLYKPHGCLSILHNPEAPMVLTAKDYYHSMKKRKLMYDQIRQLVGKVSTLFVGYSLVDYNFNNIYYELQETLGNYLARSYSVFPVPAHKSRYLERVYQQRDIALIDDKFDTFFLILSHEAGFVNGQVQDMTLEELSRPNVVQSLGPTYARRLPPNIQTELTNRSIEIP